MRFFAVFCCLFFVNLPAVGDGVRLKDLVDIDGIRDNQLVGFGLVVGLAGTGDGNDATLDLAQRLLTNMRQNFNVDDLNNDNIAMVMVTADLPPFARSGARIPVQVATMGDADSLRGGILIQTLLKAADGNIYAAAQGPLSVGGFGNASSGLSPTGVDHINIETVASLPKGAIVEREVPVEYLMPGNELRFRLRQPDFTTALAVNSVLSTTYGNERTEARDAGTVVLRFAERPSLDDLVATIAEVEQLRVSPDQTARVVINSRTGTVVIGADVRLSPVALAHGGLSLQILPQEIAEINPNDPNEIINSTIYPDPISGRAHESMPTGLRESQVNGGLNLIEGPTIEAIVNALNGMGPDHVIWSQSSKPCSAPVPCMLK